MRAHQCVVGVVGCMFWLLAAHLSAEVIIEETFSGYPDDSLITVSPAGAATGLTGDWAWGEPNNAGDFYVNRTQDDLGAGTGKAVYDRPSAFNGTRHAVRNTSADHVLFSEGGDVFYASFLIDTPRANGQMLFELDLNTTNDGQAANFAFGINGGEYLVGSSVGNIAASGGSVFAGEQLIVVRVEYGDTLNGSTNNELITLWVDPTDESSASVFSNVEEDFLNAGGGKVTGVGMRGAQMLGSPAFFDNLRVGDSFASVVPEPSTLALLAVGLVALVPLMRRRRR